MTKGMTDKRVIYALLGVVALCFLGLGFSLYRARLERLQGLQGRLRKKEAEFSELRAKMRKQPELERKYATLSQRLSFLETGLPSYAYIPTFLRQLEGLAGRTRNEVLRIQPKPAPKAAEGARVEGEEAEPGGEGGGAAKAAGSGGKNAKAKAKEALPYGELPIEVRVRGRYSAAINFLDELRRFPKMIAVNDLEFQPVRQGAQEKDPDLAIRLDLIAVMLEGGKKWQIAARPSSSS
jgi:Tfp pilus assembly protein PilO